MLVLCKDCHVPTPNEANCRECGEPLNKRATPRGTDDLQSHSLLARYEHDYQLSLLRAKQDVYDREAEREQQVEFKELPLLILPYWKKAERTFAWKCW